MEIILLSALTFKLKAPVKQCEQSYINRYINFYRCGFHLYTLTLFFLCDMHAQRSVLMVDSIIATLYAIHYVKLIIILEY